MRSRFYTFLRCQEPYEKRNTLSYTIGNSSNIYLIRDGELTFWNGFIAFYSVIQYQNKRFESNLPIFKDRKKKTEGKRKAFTKDNKKMVTATYIISMAFELVIKKNMANRKLCFQR